MRKFITMLLCAALLLALACPVYAAQPPRVTPSEAGAYLQERGIYQGDGSGSLKLDKGLTRAEMAALLTRLHGEGEVNPEHYTWACYFTDVPAWAKPYVGYCVASLLVNGYDESHYGPNDMVTPAMACTVVLRCCGYESREGEDWKYGTACDYSARLGLISEATAKAPKITRGEMAVLIYQALKLEEQGSPPPPSSSGEYTISTDHWSREDFSRQANPAVFTGVYDRALYNTIRQTIVDGDAIDPPAYTMVAKGADYSAVVNVMGRLDNIKWFEHYVPKNFTNYWQYLDYYAVSSKIPPQFEAPLAYIQPVIAEVNKMNSDRERIAFLNDYLCSLLAYRENEYAGIPQAFAPHSNELVANCGAYAVAFKFLCGAADIPCFTISTDTHTWNLVYVEGQWLHVDVSLNDVTHSHTMLLRETYPNHPDQAPEATAFIKELLVPGSTK